MKDRFQGLSQILISIENDKLRGELTEEEAKELFEMHKTAVKTAPEAIAGLSMLLIEAVINAAMGAIRDVVNTATGWKIIP